MTQAPPAVVKLPTESPQPPPGQSAKPSGRAKKASRAGRHPVLASGNGRAATRGDGEVIELEYGVTVYPARSEQGRWRAVWHEDGQRQQCEAATEDKLAGKLEKVKVRLEADARRCGRRAPPSSPTTWPLTGCRSASGDRASTRTARAGCARFTPPR